MRRLILLLTLLCLASTASASAETAPVLDGVDLNPLVDYFRPQVFSLKKPITVYNWSASAKRGDGPETFEQARAAADVFWQFYGTQKDLSVLWGHGLYGAIDPIVTEERFSGGGKQWRLLVMTLPQGFRLIDISNVRLGSGLGDRIPRPRFPDEIAEKFDCSEIRHPRNVFWAGGMDLKPKCKELVHKVFGEGLKIDGFIHDYSSSKFKACVPGKNTMSRAILITSRQWMSPELIRYYTRDSRQNSEERQVLQTLFLEQAGAPATNPLITASQPNASSHGILWKDLIGKPKSHHTSRWLQNNIFGCDGQLPYQTSASAKQAR